jgi:hypothetical protein
MTLVNDDAGRIAGMSTLALFVLSALWAGEALAKASVASCCFTNTAYTGACEVTPAKGESCKSILQYLNTPNSLGKTYCGNTAVRGGWTQASCSSKE